MSQDPYVSEEITPAEPIITLPGKGAVSTLPYDDFFQRLDYLPANYGANLLKALFSVIDDHTERDMNAVLAADTSGQAIIDHWVRENNIRLEFLSRQLEQKKPVTLHAQHPHDGQDPVCARRKLISNAAAAATFGFFAAVTREAILESSDQKNAAALAAGVPAAIYSYTNFIDYLVEERFLRAVKGLNARIEESYFRQFGKPLQSIQLAPGLSSLQR